MIYRRLLVVVWLGLIVASAMLSWPKQPEEKVEAQQVDPLRYQILTLQVKLSIGARELSQRTSSSSTSGKAISSSLTAPLIEVLTPDPSQPSIYRIQYVLANFFDLEEARKQLEGVLSKSNDSNDKLALLAYQSDMPTLTPTERESLSRSLGDFAAFLNATPESFKRDYPERVEAALHLLYKIIIGFSVLGALAFVALISFGAFCYLIFRGKLRVKPVATLQAPERLLETFCLYLGAMISISLFVLPWAASTFQIMPLYLNVIMIPLLLSVFIWPLARGTKAPELRAALALKLGGLRRALADVVVAPFAYLAGWVVIAFFLVIYALVLQVFQVDPSSGAHPVVPMLLGSDDTGLLIAVILLAVVVAPIIEEIMFRGALYGWLRSKLPAWSSVIISAACFAVMHPQGAIGIVPLGLIGILLAVLREWRGSLLAPMVAHACFNGGTLVALLTLFR